MRHGAFAFFIHTTSPFVLPSQCVGYRFHLCLLPGRQIRLIGPGENREKRKRFDSVTEIDDPPVLPAFPICLNGLSSHHDELVGQKMTMALYSNSD
jgi:hypothetical protein